MSVRPIVLWPEPVLRGVAEEVTAFDDALRRLAADMLDTMYDAPGRGLAGPQVGVARRIFVMDTEWKDEGERHPRVFVNPRLSGFSEARSIGPEGCLSLPGFALPVVRSMEVTIDWQDETGAPHSERLTGFDAICAQHEYDHLDGVLTLDRADPEALAEVEAHLAALRDPAPDGAA